MTRQEAKENLKTLGIEEPTEEQISHFLNQVNGETQKERERADKFKKDASRVGELESKLKEIEDANLSDLEKAQKDNEKAEQRIAELERKIERSNTLKSLADKGITGEDAEKLINEDGKVDFEILGKILSEREEAAATKKEKEIAEGASNPGGGSSSGDDTRTEPEKLVSKLFSEKTETKQDIISNYI